MRLTRRLLVSYLAVVLVAGAVFTAAADLLLRRRLEREAIAELEREARYLAALVDHLPAGHLEPPVRRLAERTGRRLTVIGRDGRVLADSDFPGARLAGLDNHASRPEVAAALAGSTGVDLRRSRSTGRDELKVAVPAARLIARVSSPMPQVDAALGGAGGAVLIGALAAAGAALLLALRFASSVARPLAQLRDAAQSIARGERPVLDTRGRDEIGDLARALRTMEEHLATRLAELERERSETAALITSMVEGVVACDSRGAVTAINPAARDLLGLAADDPPPGVRELFLHRQAREAVESVLAGDTVSALEIELFSRRAHLSGTPLAGGGAVFVVHDVTRLKRLEQVRRDFVANVSHELKTPLTVVRGYAETLLHDDPEPAVRRRFLEATLHNAQRMQRLIDDLLDLSRIESGGWRPHPAEVALEPLAREAWAAVRAGAAAAHQFALELAPDATRAWADADALRQILANVLDNAVRHAPAGGRVTLRSARVPGAARIEVSDTGPGIPSDHLPRIFERFYRVDPARSREVGGTGLGLAIVKHLVEAHGGRVEAESVLGRGTTIRFTLPAA